MSPILDLNVYFWNWNMLNRKMSGMLLSFALITGCAEKPQYIPPAEAIPDTPPSGVDQSDKLDALKNDVKDGRG